MLAPAFRRVDDFAFELVVGALGFSQVRSQIVVVEQSACRLDVYLVAGLTADYHKSSLLNQLANPLLTDTKSRSNIWNIVHSASRNKRILTQLSPMYHARPKFGAQSRAGGIAISNAVAVTRLSLARDGMPWTGNCILAR